jgi:hypothetical protein
MTLMNRRNLLKGFAAFPLLSTLKTGSRIVQKETGDNPKCDPAKCAPIPLQMNYVNLIFHGTWIYLIYDDHIQALAPRIEASSGSDSGHVAGMGGKTVLKEDALPPGSYELYGFETNLHFTPPDPWHSVVLDARKARIRKIDDTAANLYYSIKLPFPDAMTPAGHMRIRSVKGNGDPFQAKNRYLTSVLNRPGQRFPSVQIFTYRPSVKGGVPLQPSTAGRDEGCYEDACYHPPTTLAPKPEFVEPAFNPVAPTSGTGNKSNVPIPFSNSYEAPNGIYAQYHLAYVVHRCNESGKHEDHSFDRLASTIGIDAHSDFCSYHFEELPMAIPLGLTPGQVNLDDFPYQITRGGKTGWYSEQGALDLLNAVDTPKPLSKVESVSELAQYDKPIGNCRSGHLMVINPPSPNART